MNGQSYMCCDRSIIDWPFSHNLWTNPVEDVGLLSHKCERVSSLSESLDGCRSLRETSGQAIQYDSENWAMRSIQGPIQGTFTSYWASAAERSPKVSHLMTNAQLTGSTVWPRSGESWPCHHKDKDKGTLLGSGFIHTVDTFLFVLIGMRRPHEETQ